MRPATPLEPVTGRGGARWLRVSLALAAMAALFGFVVGSQVGTSRPSRTGPIQPSGAVASTTSASPTLAPFPVLNPQSILAAAPGGSACDLLESPHDETNLSFHRTWLFRCALALTDRPGVVSALTAGIQATLAPGVVVSESEMQDPKSPLIVDWWRYEATGLVGSVEFIAFEAGPSFELVIVQTAGSN